MKLEKQVCTYDQAKRLKELDVDQNSLFYWNWFITHPDEHEICYGKQEPSEYLSNIQQYSAFTVAELGEMFIRGSKAAEKLYDAVCDRLNSGHSFTIAYSPSFLANCLIGAIEKGFITVEEINNRLNTK